uniref:EGF-like domain-containing protein n=1 Tax=Plectus sambesii TaxID=2011161 RepID=A0A914X054_9BILA
MSTGPGINAYKCICVPGTTGTYCNTNIDECQSNPCVFGNCTEGPPGSYECTCIPGYYGPNCENEIVQCQSDPCMYGNCTKDIAGFFVCKCNPGYTGQSCEIDIDECASDPCTAVDNAATCIDEPNGFSCTCSADWTDTLCDLEAVVWNVISSFWTNNTIPRDWLEALLANATISNAAWLETAWLEAFSANMTIPNANISATESIIANTTIPNA